jgi:hypothetical protein
MAFTDTVQNARAPGGRPPQLRWLHDHDGDRLPLEGYRYDLSL